jgi:hypothetical protein
MPDLRHVDVRVIDRYLKRGKISREELEQHLAALPDLADQAEEVDYEDLLKQDEPLPAIPKTAPGGGTPILSGGSAAGPLPPLPVSRSS